MAVVAKFYIAELKRASFDPEQLTVVMQAVTRGEENKEWSKYTPSGNITMVVKNEAVKAEWNERLGQEFLVTFEPIVKPE